VNTPRKHHYVPVFYLKQWAGADRRLCEYKRVPGKILTRRTFPDGTGYEKDLYRVDGLPEPLAQEVESKFMHMVDTNAKRALDKIISGDESRWEEKPRSAWTRFILSLRFRNPEVVHDLKRHMLEVWKAGVDHLQANYHALRLPSDPPTFEEYMERCKPEAPYKGALLLLQQIIDNDRVGPTIFDMHWSRVSVAASSLPLLTSDRLLDMPHGLGSKNAYIALPIAPRMLFVAAHDNTWEKRLGDSDPTHVVKSVNAAVVSQARKFVWGVDDSQLRFVQNHMGTASDRPIITEEQKQQAINAAAGR